MPQKYQNPIITSRVTAGFLHCYISIHKASPGRYHAQFISHDRHAMLAALFKMMSDGQFHSGESLGKALGVSRAAVWKSLKRLKEDGYPIQRVRGKGYRVPFGAALLDLDEITKAVPGKLGAEVQWQLLGAVDSTNAQLMKRLSMDRPRLMICMAEQQTAGRGRRGREWVSPYGQNIYLSLALPFSGGAQRLEGLSLLVGLVLVETLEASGFKGCALKWPNDVLLDGRKLAGILIEIAGDLTSDCVAIIGVGVNVLMNDADAAIDQAWTSLLLSRQSGVLNRNILIAEFVERLLQAVQVFRIDGFAPFAAAWEKRDAWYGLPVSVRSGAASIDGVELGVDARGALRLRTADGEVLLNGGEVSLRLQHDS